MASKFLEISSGKGLPPQRCEITEVEPDIFMLKTKESHIGLLEYLDIWLQKNYRMKQSVYSDLLWDRPSPMRQVLSAGETSILNVDQVGPRRNLEEMSEETDLADNLFIGCEKQLMQ